MDAQRIGNTIKILRKNLGYTQKELADCLNVTDKAVSKWERGQSVPDIAIITKLSLLLNCDIDNLLEGNIAYLERNWQGLLILTKNEEIFSGSEVYGKPLVYFYLSYFMLAGIRKIFIDCLERDRRWIEEHIGDGSKYGIELIFRRPQESRNTMVVYNNPFVYGPNLTKYFQRAMSRPFGISVLTMAKTISGNEIQVTYDYYKAIQDANQKGIIHFCVPIVFFPKKFFNQIENVEDITSLEPLYAEPMGNGMIEYQITDKDSLLDTSSFLRFLRKRMGKEIYELKEIAQNRNFIKP